MINIKENYEQVILLDDKEALKEDKDQIKQVKNDVVNTTLNETCQVGTWMSYDDSMNDLYQ